MNRLISLPILFISIFLLYSSLRGFAQPKPLIGVAGIQHESNSFNVQKAVLKDFNFFPGESTEARSKRFFANSNSKTTSAGYIEGSNRFGLELYPAIITSAQRKGPVTTEAFEAMMQEIMSVFKSAPKLQGILLDLHGAMIVENYPSGDEEIVRRLRQAFGPDMPIIVTHDFHANITPGIIENSNVLLTAKENPHLDDFELGIKAAEIMSGIIKNGLKPVQSLVKPPLFYNIVFQNTFAKPLLPITTESKMLEKLPDILAASVAAGYQYGDVPWMGPSIVVVTNNDKELADREAKRLGEMLWATRHDIILNLPNPAEAVRLAIENTGRPVVLIDLGDNIGGGSTGDGSILLEELIKQKAQGWAMVIFDPEAYKIAEEAGVGNSFDFSVGGKIDSMHGKPVKIKGQVRSLNVGKYIENEVRHHGARYWDMGYTAVIHVEGSTLDEPNLLLLTTKPASPNSAHHLISNGVYVERQKILVVKGAIAPRAAFEPFASKIISVDSPGATAINPSLFHYKNIRKGLFGLEQKK